MAQRILEYQLTRSAEIAAWLSEQAAVLHQHPSLLLGDSIEHQAWVVSLLVLKWADTDHLAHTAAAAKAVKHKWQSQVKIEDREQWCEWVDKALQGSASLAHKMVKKQAMAQKDDHQDLPLADQLAKEQAD